MAQTHRQWREKQKLYLTETGRRVWKDPPHNADALLDEDGETLLDEDGDALLAE